MGYVSGCEHYPKQQKTMSDEKNTTNSNTPAPEGLGAACCSIFAESLEVGDDCVLRYMHGAEVVRVMAIGEAPLGRRVIRTVALHGRESARNTGEERWDLFYPIGQLEYADQYAQELLEELSL